MNGQTGETLWLFDLGNTRLKGRWSRGHETGRQIDIHWTTPEPGRRLREVLADWPSPARVLVASVASDERALHLRLALQEMPRQMVEWLASPRQGCGITNAYHHPERLGIDRFLAMVGAREASDGAAFVLAGCGTALTLDAVDAHGRQGEGLIAPSPELMMRSLHVGTAIGEANPDAFARGEGLATDDTRQAIQAGCWRAAAALVESFHANRLGEPGGIALWLHGGGAQALQALLETRGVVSPRILGDAVWRGLEIWAAQLCDHP